MVVICYLWGHKVYPVNYNVGKIGAYTILALVVLYTRNLIVLDNTFATLSVSTLFMLLYIGILYYFERKNIKKLLCV